MNRVVDFVITEESLKILEEKSRYFHVSKDVILDWMIKEFSSSTLEERKMQKENRDEKIKEFLGKSKSLKLKRAWLYGYHAGWNLFQGRKSNSLYKKVGVDLGIRLGVEGVERAISKFKKK